MPLSVLWIVAIMNMVNFLDGLDGLAAGVCGDLRRRRSPSSRSRSGSRDAAILSAIVAGACLGFLRHNFYPGPDLHGRLGRAPPRVRARDGLGPGPAQDRGDRRALLPAVRARRADLDTSFVVARRLKHGSRSTWRTARHLHHRFLNIGFSQRRAVIYLYAWCATLAGAALATRFVPPARRRWHLWPTVVVAASASSRVGASLYIVYLLEIVKLANPRIRRREEAAREAARKSA